MDHAARLRIEDPDRRFQPAGQREGIRAFNRGNSADGDRGRCLTAHSQHRHSDMYRQGRHARFTAMKRGLGEQR